MFYSDTREFLNNVHIIKLTPALSSDLNVTPKTNSKDRRAGRAGPEAASSPLTVQLERGLGDHTLHFIIKESKHEVCCRIKHN